MMNDVNVKSHHYGKLGFTRTWGKLPVEAVWYKLAGGNKMIEFDNYHSTVNCKAPQAMKANPEDLWWWKIWA